jgi:uncharacterized coiled-coil protein SlyX
MTVIFQDLTVKQVSDGWGIPDTNIRRALKAGKLPGAIPPNDLNEAWQIPRADVIALYGPQPAETPSKAKAEAEAGAKDHKLVELETKLAEAQTLITHMQGEIAGLEKTSQLSNQMAAMASKADQRNGDIEKLLLMVMDRLNQPAIESSSEVAELRSVVERQSAQIESLISQGSRFWRRKKRPASE